MGCERGAPALASMTSNPAPIPPPSAAPEAPRAERTKVEPPAPEPSSQAPEESRDDPEPKPKVRAPAKARGCVDAARDARSRYLRRSEESSPRDAASIDRIGDLDGDGNRDIMVHFAGSCSNRGGCQPYYLYLRAREGGAPCDRFVGAFDGLEPRLDTGTHHGLRDLRVASSGLYGESEQQLTFDGSRYLKVAERARDREDVDKPWGRWSKWKRFAKGVSAEER